MATSAFSFRPDGGDAGRPALVLANSLGAESSMWDEQVAAWAPRYRVLRFDYGGHGSGASSAPLTADPSVLASAVLQALDGIGIDGFRWVGLSLGSMLGLQVAALAPKRVERLVVANGRYFQEPAGQAMWSERIDKVRADGVGGLVDPTLERWFTEPYRRAHPERVAALGRSMRAVSAEGYAAGATMVRDFDARPWLEAIRAPTYVVAGAQDGAAPAPHLATLATALGAELCTFDPCAHLSNIECADAFTAKVGAFLA